MLKVSTPRRIDYECLCGKHKTYLERKLRQFCLALPIDIQEELAILKQLSLNTDTCQELTNLARYLYSKRTMLCPNTYAIRLSKYSYAYYEDNQIFFMPADAMVAKLESLIKSSIANVDRDSLENIIEFIHSSVSYFNIGSSILIKVYRLESKMAFLRSLSNVCFNEDEMRLYHFFFKKIQKELEATLDPLERNTSYTVRVWLLRELYYFISPFSGFDDNQFCQAYDFLLNADEKAFRSLMYDLNTNHFGCTNPEIYLSAKKAYEATKSLPKMARFNALLNLSHCNGTMATKYIHVRRSDFRRGQENVIDFLDDLSAGLYTSDVQFEMYKLLGVKPQWFIK